MSTNVVQLGGVRKPSLVLIKGGRGKPATPPLTDDERYPRFPPAWVDWLVLGLLLAMVNLPSPAPPISIGIVVLIAFLVARRIAKDGGDDPNCQNGTTVVLASFFLGLMGSGLKRPLERTMSVEPFTKHVMIFFVCETILYLTQRFITGRVTVVTLNFLTTLIFVGVALLGLKTLM